MSKIYFEACGLWTHNHCRRSVVVLIYVCVCVVRNGDRLFWVKILTSSCVVVLFLFCSSSFFWCCYYIILPVKDTIRILLILFQFFVVNIDLVKMAMRSNAVTIEMYMWITNKLCCTVWKKQSFFPIGSATCCTRYNAVSRYLFFCRNNILLIWLFENAMCHSLHSEF